MVSAGVTASARPRHFHGYLAAALLLALAAAWPLWAGPGFLNTRGGGDSPFLLQRVQQMVAAWRAGHFPARWMPDANYGFGYPFFNYYAPLSVAVAGFWHWLGIDVVRAIQLSQILAFLAAAGGMFTLARRWFQRDWAALLASAAYTLAPFHLVNVYVRGDSLAEFWAMACYPWVLWSLDRWLAQPRRVNFGLLGLSYAALILSHNISALIFSPWVLLYAVLRGGGWTWRRAFGLAAALGWALALAAWFWWPALAEQNLAQLGPVTQGYFHYSGHFRSGDLVQPGLMFDYDVADGRAFRLGLAQAITIVVGLAGLADGVRRGVVGRRLGLFISLTLLGATLMITPLSRALWEHLPLLPFTQFPWRFLSVQALVGAGALAGGAVSLVERSRRRWGRTGGDILLCGALAVLAATSLGGLRPDYVQVGEVSAESLALYEWFTGNIGSTISAEYLPPAVNPRPFTSAWLNAGLVPEARQRAVILAGEARADGLSGSPLRPAWRIVVVSAESRIMLPILYWPGWVAEEQGARWPIAAAPGSGLIELTLPRGAHDISLRLTRTPVRAQAETVSLIAGLLGLFWLARPLSALVWRCRRQWAWLPPALLLFVLARGLPPPAAGPLTWDFAQAAILHPSPAGVAFSQGARLAEYHYSAQRAQAGQSWRVTLVWEAGAGAATLALTTPAAQRAAPEQPVAPFLSLTQPVRPGPVVYHFDLPATFPAGLILPQLRLADGVALAENGAERGDLYLPPVVVDSAESLLPPLTTPFAVTVTQFSQPATDQLSLHLAWRTARPLSQNYAAALRVLDSRYQVYAAADAQPGANYSPTSAWLPGAPVHDWLTLAWRATDSRPPYVILASLYDPVTGRAVFTRRLGTLSGPPDALTFAPPQPQFALPPGVTPLTAIWGEQMALRGYTWDDSAESLALTLYWQALGPQRPDYTHFVHLLGPDGALIPGRQHDAMPQANTYPTSQWAAGEVAADPALIDLTGLPPGDYRLAVGLYQNLGATFPRLPLVKVEGADSADNALILPFTLTLRP